MPPCGARSPAFPRRAGLRPTHSCMHRLQLTSIEHAAALSARVLHHGLPSLSLSHHPHPRYCATAQRRPQLARVCRQHSIRHQQKLRGSPADRQRVTLLDSREKPVVVAVTRTRRLAHRCCCRPSDCRSVRSPHPDGTLRVLGRFDPDWTRQASRSFAHVAGIGQCTITSRAARRPRQANAVVGGAASTP